MLEPAISAGAFLSQLIAGFSGESPAETAAGGDSTENFARILASQENLSEVLARLRELLPEAAFARIEVLLAEGKGLPQAADVAGQALLSEDGGLLQAADGQALPETMLTPEDMAQIQAVLAPVLPAVAQQVYGKAAGQPAGAVLPDDAARRAAVPPWSAGREGGLATAGAVLQPAIPQAPTPSSEAVALAASEAVTAGLGTVLPQVLKSGSASGDSSSLLTVNVGALSAALTQSNAESAVQARPPLSAPADMDIPLGNGKWDRSLGDRVLWMIGRAQQSASIKITPPDLGAIDIKVSVRNDQVNVGFTAQHAAVREALEAAVPRLREMLGDNNLQLVNVDVGQRGETGQRASADDFAGQQGEARQPAYASVGEGSADNVETQGLRYYRSDGLLDDYA